MKSLKVWWSSLRLVTKIRVLEALLVAMALSAAGGLLLAVNRVTAKENPFGPGMFVVVSILMGVLLSIPILQFRDQRRKAWWEKAYKFFAHRAETVRAALEDSSPANEGYVLSDAKTLIELLLSENLSLKAFKTFEQRALLTLYDRGWVELKLTQRSGEVVPVVYLSARAEALFDDLCPSDWSPEDEHPHVSVPSPA